MRLGIIVHSYTGNTFSVAEKLQAKLIETGHQAEIERIKIVGGEQPNSVQFQIENPPDAGQYDALIVGGPVRGFSVSPVIAAYLQQVSSLKDKKVACFVTKHLSSSWTGGNRALKSMKSFCEAKGGTVAGTGIIFWKSKDRDREIDALAEKMCSLFG